MHRYRAIIRVNRLINASIASRARRYDLGHLSRSLIRNQSKQMTNLSTNIDAELEINRRLDRAESLEKAIFWPRRTAKENRFRKMSETAMQAPRFPQKQSTKNFTFISDLHFQ